MMNKYKILPLKCPHCNNDLPIWNIVGDVYKDEVGENLVDYSCSFCNEIISLYSSIAIRPNPIFNKANKGISNRTLTKKETESVNFIEEIQQNDELINESKPATEFIVRNVTNKNVSCENQKEVNAVEKNNICKNIKTIIKKDDNEKRIKEEKTFLLKKLYRKKSAWISVGVLLLLLLFLIPSSNSFDSIEIQQSEATDVESEAVDAILIAVEEPLVEIESKEAINKNIEQDNLQPEEPLEIDVREVNDELPKNEQIAEKITNNEESSLEIHYIDVGQGDSALIICDNEAMIIDAGNNDKGTYIQKYLYDQGVKKLKYVIGTHPDADHIGGLDVVITKFDCENILFPDASSDTKTYEEVISAIKYKSYKITTVAQGDIFNLGNSSFEILSPIKEKPYAENNNNSIVLRLDHYNNSFLFMGDAEYQPQQVIYYDDEINAKADVIKVSHHGANSGYMKAFYDEVAPKYAVISVGKDNSYGHPHEEVLNDFKVRGVEVFRTDEQGSIIVKSDGENITFNIEPSQTWATGITKQADDNPDNVATPKQTENSIQPSEEANITEASYIVNGENGKIHIAGGCGSQPKKNPIPCSSYEEAEELSKQIDSNLEKRKCGNCYK